MRVAVVGASGYAGQELLRLAASHPDLEVALATGESAAGTPIGVHAPALAALYGDQRFAPTSDLAGAEVDAVFLALPHGQSQNWVPDLVERGVRVIDLGADYRLKDPNAYATWYQSTHRSSELLARAVYGLVERHRGELVGAQLVAVPGCYPTATSLALGPFLDADLIERDGIVVNALSGVSGAGRAISERLHYPRLAANAEAYSLLTHRHTPEMEQELRAQLLFTPHLVPASRGMLVTAYARPRRSGFTSADALQVLASAYRDEPFVVVTKAPPTLKDPVGSNLCFVSARVDERTGWLVALSSIDNLVKGAAGQAVQAFNVAVGLDETLGLPRAGVTP
ncbi:MAG TPA: N-acetyl-gamma-glutamyl-phosphate reductase [Acidimicrobiales bacterium]|nr:N-acetyl-gamma-glutamyl-phosphate reductase [Acidimicrobiales bacterium]